MQTNESDALVSGLDLSRHSKIFVKQVFEMGEWFGFETRNKYQIHDAEGDPIGFAAEQGKGLFGLLGRQFLGHWRSFEVHFFDNLRREVLTARHPFRWFFQRFEVYEKNGKFLGAIQRRFSILTKRFDVEDARGQTIFEVSSPIWKLWTFPFVSHQGREMAVVAKKWSGVFSEAFTDRDNFLVEYKDAALSASERAVILASAVYIDLNFFEKKA